MTTYDDRFEQSGVAKALAGVETALSAARAKDDLTELQVQGMERVGRCQQAIARWAADADPMLVTAGGMSGLAKNLNQVASTVNAMAGGEETQLAQLDAQLDASLNAAQQLLPAHAMTGDPEDLRDHVTSFRRSSGQLLAGVRNDVEELRAALSKLNESVDAAGTSQTNQLTALEGAVKQNKAVGEQALTELREKFAASQEERQERFRTTLDEKRGNLDGILERVESEAATSRETLEGRADGTLKALAQAEEQAKTLVNTVGAIGTSGGYGGYAAQQKAVADNWRRVAIAIAVVAVLVGLQSLIWGAESTSWQFLVKSSVVVSALGGLAAYAGRQSGQHRSEETAARNIELRLAAIDPYLALLEESKRDEIKGQLAQRFFAPSVQVPPPGSQNGHAPGLSANAIEAITEQIKALLQAQER